MVCWQVQRCQLNFIGLSAHPTHAHITFSLFQFLSREVAFTLDQHSPPTPPLPPLVSAVDSGKDYLWHGEPRQWSTSTCPAAPTLAPAIVRGDHCHLPPHSHLPLTWESPSSSITNINWMLHTCRHVIKALYALFNWTLLTFSQKAGTITPISEMRKQALRGSLSQDCFKVCPCRPPIQ